ncbi:dihydrolipoamide acetyltransferase family protein [Allostreptomyces psammosilenae]|nr:dihydrolipoamide acetyltransferase family protein [Allostreptomyces psammosilenae]
MPDVGEGLTEAEILKWLVKPGDAVTDGQVVCEVETAKAAVELPIPFDGVVHDVHVPEGSTVDVGAAIITVDTDPGAEGGAPPRQGGAAAEAAAPAPAAPAPANGAAHPAADSGAAERNPVLVGYGPTAVGTRRRPRRPAAAPSAPSAPVAPAAPAAVAPAPAPAPAPTPAPAAGRPAPAHAAPRQPAPAQPTTEQPPAAAHTHPTGPSDSQSRPLAKPPVRKLARDLGIDLWDVAPTGRGGVITREDVQAHAARAAEETAGATARAAEETAAGPSPAEAAPEAVPAPAGGRAERRERREPIRGVRKATAQAMVASAFTAPHVTEFVEVDVTRTMKLVQELREEPSLAGLRITPLLMVARALLLAIRRHPEINASWDEDNQEIVFKEYVNLGIAAATPRGLLVPNIKDADRMTLPELAVALEELIGTARAGRTTPQDMSGGTVTITNVGVFGIDAGTPLLNPGEAAILAFGAVREKPWVVKDRNGNSRIKPRQVTTLALSFDHRMVDGELGSLVLADVAAILERPKLLMAWA